MEFLIRNTIALILIKFGLHVKCNIFLEKSEAFINSTSFETINEWKYLDFEYPTYAQRQLAIKNRYFVPENNLPLGIDIHHNRIFITTPRWKDGVPASLGYVDYPPKERSPAIKPYPNWNTHGDPYNPNCSKLISVYRTNIDSCGRLWVIDSGIVNATVSLNQICPPKIVAFDLATDEKIVHFELPNKQVKEDSLHSNIVVDIPNRKCNDAFVYVTDVWRYGIVVYSLKKNRSWRVTNYQFLPNPQATNFNVYGINFQWLDGVFGMSLSSEQVDGYRNLYFHPMASFKEFIVSTSILRNEDIWVAESQNVANYFIEIGDRGVNGQSSSSGIDRNGVMYFTQVHTDNVGCWDTAKPYIRSNLAYFKNSKNYYTPLIQFPNDLKVDNEEEQGIWVMNNRLPKFLYSKLNFTEINFRIIRAYVKSVGNTICNVKRKTNNKKLSIIAEEGQCV